MIGLIILLLVIIIIAVEGVSLNGRSRSLPVTFSVDTRLVEPGETATLYYTVSNPSKLPVFYVGFSLYLRPDVTVMEGEEFRSIHVSKTDIGTSVSHHFFLPAYGRFKGKVQISLQGRGIHELGEYFVETGDFFGIFPIVFSERISRRIICTSEKTQEADTDFYGGDLGDISVRRFIMDDPTMLLGYREYTGNEPMKQISWNQTAKTGRLMVRQNDFTTDRSCVVLVNMYSSLRPEMEECMKLVRTVCEQLEEANVPYELMTNGDLLSVPEGTGREHLFFILKKIGLSRLMGFNTFDNLVDRCIRRRRSNCRHIVITPSVEQGVQAQIDHLGRYLDMRPVVLTPAERGTAL